MDFLWQYMARGLQRQNKSRDANQNDNALNLATDELGKVDIGDIKAYQTVAAFAV